MTGQKSINQETELEDNFCGTHCSTKVSVAEDTTVQTAPSNAKTPLPNSNVIKSNHIGPVGFSDKINNSRIKEEIVKIRKSLNGCGILAVPLHFVIYLVISFFSDKIEIMDAVFFGG